MMYLGPRAQTLVSGFLFPTPVYARLHIDIHNYIHSVGYLNGEPDTEIRNNFYIKGKYESRLTY